MHGLNLPFPACKLCFSSRPVTGVGPGPDRVLSAPIRVDPSRSGRHIPGHPSRVRARARGFDPYPQLPPTLENALRIRSEDGSLSELTRLGEARQREFDDIFQHPYARAREGDQSAPAEPG